MCDRFTKDTFRLYATEDARREQFGSRGEMRQYKSPVQCTGVTRAGRRCGITSETSRLLDDRGNNVNEPLLLGARHCRFHLRPFCTKPADNVDCLLFYLDFETSGLDVIGHHIVEIGMLCENGACYSTVVCPPVFSEEVPVHGISNEELRQGPFFVDAFRRMHRFCNNLVEMALTPDDSSGDEAATESLREDPPQILVCAHNGMKFDFPFLCSECLRNDIDIGCFDDWLFADTLEVFRAMGADTYGGCAKLQCILRKHGATADLHAHRALDDCRALKAVLESVSASLGVSPKVLIRPFVVELDNATTTAHIGMLTKCSVCNGALGSRGRPSWRRSDATMPRASARPRKRR